MCIAYSRLSDSLADADACRKGHWWRWFIPGWYKFFPLLLLLPIPSCHSSSMTHNVLICSRCIHPASAHPSIIASTAERIVAFRVARTPSASPSPSLRLFPLWCSPRHQAASFKPCYRVRLAEPANTRLGLPVEGLSSDAASLACGSGSVSLLPSFSGLLLGSGPTWWPSWICIPLVLSISLPVGLELIKIRRAWVCRFAAVPPGAVGSYRLPSCFLIRTPLVL